MRRFLSQNHKLLTHTEFEKVYQSNSYEAITSKNQTSRQKDVKQDGQPPLVAACFYATDKRWANICLHSGRTDCTFTASMLPASYHVRTPVSQLFIHLAIINKMTVFTILRHFETTGIRKKYPTIDFIQYVRTEFLAQSVTASAARVFDNLISNGWQ